MRTVEAFSTTLANPFVGFEFKADLLDTVLTGGALFTGGLFYFTYG